MKVPAEDVTTQPRLLINLDWRGGPDKAMPTREIILAKMYRLLTQPDAEGSLQIEVAATREHNSVILQDVGHGTPGQKTLVRYSKPTNMKLVANIVSCSCSNLNTRDI